MPKIPQKPARPDNSNGHPLMHDPIEQQRMKFNNWLKNSGKSLLAISREAQINESALRHYKTGKTRDMKYENKIRLAESQRVPLAEIFGVIAGIQTTPGQPGNTPASPSSDMAATVPVMGRFEDGGLTMTQHPVAYVECPKGMTLSGNVFALRIPNSDNSPRFRLREIVLCDPDDPIGSNDDCAIIETTGRIRILRCIEYATDTGFTGNIYAQPNGKITIAAENITRVARIIGMLMGV